MASLNGTFDASGVEPAAPMELLPPGRYVAQIVQSEMQPTKAGERHEAGADLRSQPERSTARDHRGGDRLGLGAGGALHQDAAPRCRPLPGGQRVREAAEQGHQHHRQARPMQPARHVPQGAEARRAGLQGRDQRAGDARRGHGNPATHHRDRPFAPQIRRLERQSRIATPWTPSP